MAAVKEREFAVDKSTEKANVLVQLYGMDGPSSPYGKKRRSSSVGKNSKKSEFSRPSAQDEVVVDNGYSPTDAPLPENFAQDLEDVDGFLERIRMKLEAESEEKVDEDGNVARTSNSTPPPPVVRCELSQELAPNLTIPVAPELSVEHEKPLFL